MKLATLVLPITNNSGEDQSDTHLALRATLCDVFGGYTVTTGNGGWSDKGKVFNDPVAVYSIAMEMNGENFVALESIARFYGHMAGQICVMVVHCNGDVAFCDSSVPTPASILERV